MFTTTASRKVLVPLATLLAAGAVAVGSGATWTSSTDTSVAVTAGKIVHANDRGDATLTITKITPGETVSGSLQIRNDGDVPIDLAVSQATGTNPATPTNAFGDHQVSDGQGGFVTVSNLQLAILVDGTPVWDGDFDALPADTSLATDIDAVTDAVAGTDDTVEVTFEVSLDADSPNTDQGKTAGAKFLFVTTENDDYGDGSWTPELPSWVTGE